jgi:hypothetical protein
LVFWLSVLPSSDLSAGALAAFHQLRSGAADPRMIEEHMALMNTSSKTA